MKLKSLVLHNVLLTNVFKKEDLYEVSKELRNYVIENNLFPIDPVFYVSNDEENIRVGVQINTKVEIEGEQFEFFPALEMKTCIYQRVLDESEVEKEMQLMKEFGKKQGYEKEENYFVFSMNLYGEVVHDLYLPVKVLED